MTFSAAGFGGFEQQLARFALPSRFRGRDSLL
jgi:hypothetical protein